MLPVLPTTVVGSYSVPEWLERLKTDYYRNRISRSHLGEIHDMAVKAISRLASQGRPCASATAASATMESARAADIGSPGGVTRGARTGAMASARATQTGGSGSMQVRIVVNH